MSCSAQHQLLDAVHGGLKASKERSDAKANCVADYNGVGHEEYGPDEVPGPVAAERQAVGAYQMAG